MAVFSRYEELITVGERYSRPQTSEGSVPKRKCIVDDGFTNAGRGGGGGGGRVYFNPPWHLQHSHQRQRLAKVSRRH